MLLTKIDVIFNWYFSDFSLSTWKTENQITNSNMKASEIALLKEILGISEYLRDSCSRRAGKYFPHRNYWKDGNGFIHRCSFDMNF